MFIEFSAVLLVHLPQNFCFGAVVLRTFDSQLSE